MDTTTNAKTKTNAAPAKNKGGNDGKTPRALRGAPKAATNWTPAQEQAFLAQAKAREAFVAERTATLKQAVGLLFKGAKSEVIPAVSSAAEDGTIIREAQTLPAAITEEALLANLAEHGDQVLTYLSKHFKLIPTLAKSAH
jgi:type IV secretory pathway TrbF-like protein